MGGGGKTTHQTVREENPYDDAWIRTRFSDVDKRGSEFSQWQAGREASLDYERRIREANEAAISQLTGDFRAQQEQLAGLQRGQEENMANLQGVTTTQQLAMRDLYKQQEGGTEGVATQSGLTGAQRVRGGAYGGFNRGGMRIKGLNV